MDIVIELIRETDKNDHFVTSLKMNGFNCVETKEDIWTLHGDSLLYVQYRIYEDEEIVFKRNVRPFSLSDKVSGDHIARLNQFICKEGVSVDLKEIMNYTDRFRISMNSTVSYQNGSTILPSNNVTRIEYEERTIENELPANESFADMFFIAGISKQNAKVIPQSKHFAAPCRHKDCSVLHSYKPTILHRYPQNDYKGLRLTSSVNMA
jgi:hypothetical protein